MALIKCKECENEISDKADICPHCGFSYHKSYNRDIKLGSIICIIGSSLLICWCLLGIIIGIYDFYKNANSNNNNLTSQKSADFYIDIEINGGIEEKKEFNPKYYITILILSMITLILDILCVKKIIKSNKLKTLSITNLIISIVISIMMLTLNCCQIFLFVAPLSCFIGSIIMLLGSVKINEEAI